MKTFSDYIIEMYQNVPAPTKTNNYKSVSKIVFPQWVYEKNIYLQIQIIGQKSNAPLG